MRYLVLVVVVVAMFVVSGCTQRQPENPFVSPYSTSTPFGG
jgi:outer membrane murein-binding lipoprotein Lpp